MAQAGRSAGRLGSVCPPSGRVLRKSTSVARPERCNRVGGSKHSHALLLASRPFWGPNLARLPTLKE